MFDKLKIKSMGSPLEVIDLGKFKEKGLEKRQIYQNRYNFGVNIGACFVLEKWIFEELFVDNAGCELEAVTKLVKKKGETEAKKMFEQHWKGFMKDEDWKWLQEHNIDSVRVPLGYWEIGGGKFAKETRFAKFSESVYSNAWDIFKTHFVEKASAHNISVLVDLHGLPGGANGSDHSGEFCLGKASFWGSQGAQLLMCNMFSFIAKDLQKYDNIAGIQLVNESEFSDDGKRQGEFYAAAINAIRLEDREIPIIISDGWWPDQWAKWIQKHQKEGKLLGVVIDHHCYRCFSDSDKQKSPRQIIDDLNNDLLTNITDNGRGVDFMVGEYSCVLDGDSWNKDNAKSSRDKYVKAYGNKECELLAERATFGSYFWTYKFQWGDGGEWGLKPMMNSGAIKPPLFLVNRKVPDDSTFNKKLDDAYNSHVSYWNGQNSKEKYEHDRYKAGYGTAWNDAAEFAKNNSALGRIGFWKEMRLHQHIQKQGKLNFLWEWSQGFDKALQDFRS